MKRSQMTTMRAMLTGNQRAITERQEEALRLCHHEFEGLTETEAAMHMGISQSAVSQLLSQVKKVAPQLFPIMTKFQAQCYHHLTCDGWSPDDIAERLYRQVNSVYKALQACKSKGLPLPQAHGDIMRYTEDMDGKVTHKF
jgi:DNA-directed RNA polymerase specialized sigma24 family protein